VQKSAATINKVCRVLGMIIFVRFFQIRLDVLKQKQESSANRFIVKSSQDKARERRQYTQYGKRAQRRMA